jgi:hypothetical protein
MPENGSKTTDGPWKLRGIIMKAVGTVVGVFCGSALLFVCCGYGGPGGGGTPECRTFCDKKRHCCEIDSYCTWDEYRTAECLCECGNMYKMATAEYLRGMSACADQPCQEEWDIDECVGNLIYTCPSKTTSAVEAYCTRVYECNGEDSYTECIQMYSMVMGCLNQRAHDAFAMCLHLGTCDTMGEEVGACMDQKMGTAECDTVDY